MGSPLGPLVANVFLCSIEEQLERENKLPSFYRRYVDDTLSSVPDIQSATTFLATLNKCHPSIHFTMEIADSNKLPFLGMMIEKKDCELVTSVYRKPTNNGLLLHFQSHVDMRYKKSLIRTMLHRAYRLSSSWESIVRECDHLTGMFFKLGYPDRLVDATITSFLHSVLMDKDQVKKNNAMSERNIVRVVLPFKDQRSADFVRKQLKDLGNNIGNPIQTIFTSPKIGEQLQIQERKPPVVSRQSVVYQFKCDLCDTDYIGYTTRHLHQRIEEHRASAVGTHVKGCHGTSNPELLKQFSVLKKCQGKLDCLIREMLFIRERKPKLNTQADSIRAKVFV